jgi:serine protease Do
MDKPNKRWRIPMAALAGFGLGVVFSVGGHELGLPGPAPVDADAAADEVIAETDPLLPVAERRDAASRGNPVVEAVALTAPAVVSINCEVPTQNPFAILHSGRTTSNSQGSGAIIREDGVVLTNAHVINGATRISATLPDESVYEASVVGLDADLDLAVLQLEGAQGLPTIALGSSGDLILGETTIAIGYPFGLGHTVTTGVISSRSRTLEVAERVFQDYIQTDAGINPGNSGGPLLNIHGELIGINTAIRRDAENIGFAIPVDRAAKVARDLLLYGSVRAPWLGVAVSDIGGPRYAGSPIEQGALLVERIHSPADRAGDGLLQDDIILQVDGRSVHSRADLNLRLASLKPGDTVRVSGLRAGQPFEVSLSTTLCPDGLGRELLVGGLGIQVQTVRSVDAQTARNLRLRASTGLLVIDTASSGGFAAAGLRAGDVILAVHGQRVEQIEQLEQALLRAAASHRDGVLLTIQRGPYKGHVEVSL